MGRQELLTGRCSKKAASRSGLISLTLLGASGIPLLASDGIGVVVAPSVFATLAVWPGVTTPVRTVLAVGALGFALQVVTGLPAAAPLVVAATVLVPRIRTRTYAGPSRRGAMAWLLALLSVPVCVLVVWAAWLGPFLQSTWFWVPLLPSVLAGSLPLAIGACVLAGFANAAYEEIVWRWAIPHALIGSGIPRTGSIVASAAAFGIAHWSGIPPGPTGVLLAAAFAFASSWVVRCCGSLWPSIAAHAAIDAFLIFPLSGYAL